jgi:PKD repeat protein
MKKVLHLSVVLSLALLIPFTYLMGQAGKPSKVYKAAHFDVSKPLREITPVAPYNRLKAEGYTEVPNYMDVEEFVKVYSDYSGPDPVHQKLVGSSLPPRVLQSFEGGENLSGIAPPDTDGDVGPEHYFQMINLQFMIFNKGGEVLYGPADNSTIWDGFLGEWSGSNDGDPIVLYDEVADRWLVSQFALPNAAGPWYELIAVSATGDPLGEWYRYAFEFDRMPDYPKFGIWPDGYYFTINQFVPFDGSGVCVVDRNAMLEGDPDAQIITWDLKNIFFGVLPADFDGAPPLEGTPNYLVSISGSLLRRWECHVDWDNPNSSDLMRLDDLSIGDNMNWDIVIEQPGTTWTLDPISDRLMYRLQYRQFDGYEVLLTNHAVNVGEGRAGIRWYELRSDMQEPWYVYQQGTYAPDDGENRWMGSIAMNENGDIALGYSVSSENTYPSIRVAGQRADKPEGLGVLDIPEAEIYTGKDSQRGVNRWGDYSMMSVDPVDKQTFWFTTEYTNGGWGWGTRIAHIGFDQEPIANFTSSENSIPTGDSIDFVDLSTGFPETWNWSFSGGDPATSTSQHPQSIFYNTAGTYDVKLVTTNLEGSDSITKLAYITVSDTILPEVHFISINKFTCVGEPVKLIDQSRNSPIGWLWQFEPGTVSFLEGTDSSSREPIVAFNEAGLYDVTLTVWNNNGFETLTRADMIRCGGLSVPFHETFEDAGLSKLQWSVESQRDEGYWGLYETGGTHPGSVSAGIDFSEYFTLGERDRLISPPLNLKGLNDPGLSFVHAYATIHDELSDSLIVYVSSDCSEDWVRVFQAAEDGTGNFATHEPGEFWPVTSDDWSISGWGADIIRINLDDWKDQSGVRIRFETVNAFGNMMFIDNVRVDEYGILDTEPLNMTEELSIFPNPSDGTFRIVMPDTHTFQQLTIYNNTGQIVFSRPVDITDRVLFINPEVEWVPGIYFVRLNGMGISVTKKLIIQ